MHVKKLLIDRRLKIQGSGSMQPIDKNDGDHISASSFASIISSDIPSSSPPEVLSKSVIESEFSHESVSHLVMPQASPQGLSIVPRRKLAASVCKPTSSKPVIITSGVIQSLRGLPLPCAARSMGLSITAFKRACRRLGVRRWDYTRGPGKALVKSHSQEQKFSQASSYRSPSSPSHRGYSNLASNVAEKSAHDATAPVEGSSSSSVCSLPAFSSFSVQLLPVADLHVCRHSDESDPLSTFEVVDSEEETEPADDELVLCLLLQPGW